MEIVFYRSKEKSNYYLLYKGKNGVNAEKMLRKLTNSGEFENSGFPKVEIEFAYILKTKINGTFLEFIAENISTNHIDHPSYNNETFKAWYEFKNYEPEKWMEEFYDFQNSKIKEFMKNTQPAIQTTLF